MAKKWRVIPVAEAKEHRLYGVGGWLLLLVAGMMVLGPLLGAGRINADILMAEDQYPALTSMNEWKTFKFATWSTFITAAALSFYGGLGLVRGDDWSVVKRAKAIIWISGPGASLILGVLIPIVVFGNARGVDVKFIGALIASVIAASIWSAYLSKSRRVRVTFEHSVLADSSPAEDKSGAQPMSSQALQSFTSRTFETPTSPGSHMRGMGPMSHVHEEFWAKALAEYEGGNRRPGLWARVFSDAQGDEAVAKANYLKHRAEELSHEHHQHVLAQERAERVAIEKANLAKLSEEQRAYELLPKGHCPNCKAVIPMASDECPKCQALFTADGWKVLPIENT